MADADARQAVADARGGTRAYQRRLASEAESRHHHPIAARSSASRIAMDLIAALEGLDAPEELLSWASAEGVEGWSDCPRADWLIWIGASAGVPLVGLLEAARDCVARAVQTLSTGAGPLEQAIHVASLAWRTEPGPGDTVEACVAAARACDAAEQRFPETYRNTMQAGYPSAARAAGWLARAAEGLATAEARAEAERVEEGRSRALTLGAHPDIMVPPRRGPARLDPSAPPGDPIQQELTYGVAAAAEAVREAAHALAPTADDPHGRAEALQDLADRVRQVLPAPWTIPVR